MTQRLLILVLAALSACAAPAPAPVAPSAPVVQPPPAARESEASRLIGRAGGADAPTMEALVRVLGAADVSRQEGVGAMLTYRSDSCALVLMFTADARNEMRLREALSMPRREGEQAPALAQCVTAAEARERS